MKISKSLILNIIIIIGISAPILFLSYNVYKTIKRIDSKGIGKTIYINISNNDVVDYKSIGMGKKDENGLSKQWFDMWDRIEREKLINYMDENNFIIKPGSYELNQTTYFEEALKIFNFEKLKGKR